jgi:hypothetical protein
MLVSVVVELLVHDEFAHTTIFTTPLARYATNGFPSLPMATDGVPEPLSVAISVIVLVAQVALVQTAIFKTPSLEGAATR